MKNEETNKDIRLLSEQELGEVSGAFWWPEFADSWNRNPYNLQFGYRSDYFG